MSHPVIDLDPAPPEVSFETVGDGRPSVTWLRCGLVFYMSAASSFTLAFLMFQLLG